MEWLGTPLVQSLLLEAATFGLIFGGCCSNVYALEAIINFESSSGTLLTFTQFLFVAVTSYISQFDRTRPPFYLAPTKVPLRRWLVNILLFFGINVLNNHAFSYSISIPLHIILRSGGSITTMLAGYLFGKRYSRLQALAVILLSFGIALAAWSNDEAKVDERKPDRPESAIGFLVLFVAQLFSAALGLHTESLYQQFGPQWRENLFYCHLLSLPLFLPFMPSMARVLGQMAASERIEVSTPFLAAGVPVQLAYLATNVITQYACIRGVNLLAANSSALTVTIVLSVRKLVSLIVSIWLFGNSLPKGTLIGAIIVFSSGALYSMGRAPKTSKDKHSGGMARKEEKQNGSQKMASISKKVN
ncbi:hypothetical protein CDD80_3261 [Ophiocordyceps camponoti-rufipedis]|uniref:Sugar phosphate transporter domain-containing protein n=1 Tax=Ophiocordyceps camponoti-rufipedis TaxID=2004952 RepID=A0A2C5ZJ15_9HYPO|nr:hypothetical protein CDD80_3261 [Ophiocordyceps camponoti-rufipedis]